jgi:hypothetical protein
MRPRRRDRAALQRPEEAAFSHFLRSARYWQLYIRPSSSLVKVPGVHLNPLRVL